LKEPTGIRRKKELGEEYLFYGKEKKFGGETIKVKDVIGTGEFTRFEV